MRIARGTCITAVLVLFAAFGGVAIAGDGDSPANASEAKVTRQQAEKVALAHVPGGAIKEAELEKENGRLVWSFDVALPKGASAWLSDRAGTHRSERSHRIFQ
jgi:hypothetical protein